MDETRPGATVVREALPPPTLAPMRNATGTALLLPDGLTWEQWEQLGPPVLTAASGAMWWAGDWYQYAVTHLLERDEAGKATSASKARLRATIATATGVEYGALKHARQVAGKFPPVRRRTLLAFGHHEAVATCSNEMAETLLDWAEEGVTDDDGNWRIRSVADLRAERRRREATPVKEVEAGETPDAHTPTPVTVSIEVAPELAAEVATLRPILEHWRASGTITAAAFELLSRMVDAAEKAGKAAAGGGRSGRAAA